MISQAARDAMNIALSQSIKTTTLPSGFNQYTVRRELNLTQHDQAALIIYAQKQQGRTIEDAVNLVKAEAQRAVSKRASNLIPLHVIVCFILLMMAVGALVETIFVPLAFMIPVVYVLILHLIGAKKRKAKSIWKEHALDLESALAALKEMEEVLEGSPMAAASKPMVIGCVLLALLCAAPVVTEMLPDPLYVQLNDAVVNSAANTDYDDALALITADGRVSEKGMEAFMLDWEEASSGSIVRYNLAVLACKAVDAGFPEDQAKACAKDVLTNSTFSGFRTDKAFANFALLLQAAPEAVDASLYARLEESDVLKYDTARTALMSMLEDKSLTELLNMRAQVIAEEADGDAFTSLVLAGRTVEDARSELPAVDDAELQLIALQCFAASTKEPDEVLAYIRLGKELGYTPLQCYPEGAVINLPTAHFSLNAEAGDVNLFGTYLLLRRTEQEEPFETKTVPSSKWSIGDDFISMFAEDYDGNSVYGDAAYTVVLDTGFLSRMDEAYIPESFAACDIFIVADSIYLMDSTFRNTSYTDSLTLANISAQTDVACYASVQMIACYDAATGAGLMTTDVLVTESPTPPSMNTTSLVSSFSSLSTMKQYYLAEPNPEWVETAVQEFTDTLESNNWSLLLTLLSYAE